MHLDLQDLIKCTVKRIGYKCISGSNKVYPDKNLEHYKYIGSEFLTAADKNIPIFWDTTPCGPIKVNQRFRRKYILHIFTPVSCLVYSSTLKMETTYSSETFVNFKRDYVEFEVLTAVVRTSTMSLDTTPYFPLKMNRCFGGTRRFNLQSLLSQVRYQRESRWLILLRSWRRHFTPKRPLTFIELQGVIFQKIIAMYEYFLLSVICYNYTFLNSFY
jgi:hypothetical protein